jgi:hypothetical protein
MRLRILDGRRSTCGRAFATISARAAFDVTIEIASIIGSGPLTAVIKKKGLDAVFSAGDGNTGVDAIGLCLSV